MPIFITNIYAPTLHSEKQAFLAEIADLAPQIDGPWLLLGDFNLTRVPSDKNNDHFNSTEARMFNDLINNLALIEIPLVDRAYTWSNRCEDPTLVRLDRCLVNLDWESLLPNMCLTSLTHSVSDHVPLVLTATTKVPKGGCFKFENVWLNHSTFKAQIPSAINTPTQGTPARSFVRRLKTCRSMSRSWARSLRPIDQRENDPKILIDALDSLEECRPLSRAEDKLRSLTAQGLAAIRRERLAHWRQRFNLKMAVEWDEDTKFFHMAANGRRRKNYIACLEHDGDVFSTHEAKATILLDFYKDLLGSCPPTAWRFDLNVLYPHLAVSGQELSSPFTMDEITAALFMMDANASPGPDGFGPSFYKAFWTELKIHVATLFSDFYSGCIDMDGLNHAHLILLPKHEGVRTACGFRPISLQNCPMKLFSKAMVNRLKLVTPNIIDNDQTGFVPGRSIAENFIYAADLLSCCHKRRKPTVVLKLDFKKAFDSISWESLDKILACRGFNERWRTRVANILASGKTSIVLNGVPGKWVNCKRGLQQGDPISPYLFIIVADVLQRLVRQAASQGALRHPIDPSLPCTVLQYADDTLILLEGDTNSLTRLKSILDDFSLATGLTINFHKSTFVPLHIDASTATAMADILGCQVSGFPQTYLGLPLTPYKLRVCDFQPLITKFDPYLEGWKARLLSTGGRLILVNAVLSNLATYYMSVILLPKTVMDDLESRRRAFLWIGEEKCHGSKCLVAWDDLCQLKDYGGLGVRPLIDQNHSLLQKLHYHSVLPWKEWFNAQHLGGLGDCRSDSYIANIVQAELRHFRDLTSVRLGDGRHTSFWHDWWLLNTTLAATFPALYSHCVMDQASVRSVLTRPLHTQFRPRLTRAAEVDRATLETCLTSVTLSETPDIYSLAAN